MANVINDANCIYVPSARGKMAPSANSLTNGVFRLPSDPVFYADFTISNIVSGSSYWIAQSSNLANVLASGTAGGTSVTVSGMASYDTPQMLVTVRVRKSGSGTYYQPFETQAYHQKTGAGTYVIQSLDTTA